MKKIFKINLYFTKLYKFFIAFSILAAFACSSESERVDTNDINESSTDSASIIAKAWNLKTYSTEDGNLLPVPVETVYQIFLNAGTDVMEGFIGCVNTFGSYALTDGSVSLTIGASDDEECITDTEEYATQTREIMRLMEPPDNIPLMYNLENNVLKLVSPSGRSLEFEQIPRLQQQM